MSELSTKPYLLRAIYEWCADNGYTPYIAVAVDERTQVPREYVRNGEIVLNVSGSATNRLVIGNERVEFQARFGGVPRDLSIPVDQVSAIYARENGHGMAFDVPKAPAHVEPPQPGSAPRPVEAGKGAAQGPRRGGPVGLAAVPPAPAPAPRPELASSRDTPDAHVAPADGETAPGRGAEGSAAVGGNQPAAPAAQEAERGAAEPERGGDAGERPAPAPSATEGSGAADAGAGTAPAGGAAADAPAGEAGSAGEAGGAGEADAGGPAPEGGPEPGPGKPGRPRLTRVK